MIRPKSVRALIDAVRIARANPHARFGGKGVWPELRSTDVLDLWRKGVMARCNRGLPDLGPDQVILRRDVQRINDYVGKRMRCTGCRGHLTLPRMQKRYPHINNQSMGDL